MVKLYESSIYLVNGETIVTDSAALPSLVGKTVSKEEATKGTMAYGILKAHNTTDHMDKLQLKFDSMTSHDITYVGIIQTARASGMTEFPLPYVLTNCHNSLCAVGGTINEDDHKFALSAAHKYGGIYVPTNMANIHSYNRETMAGCGRMILGSDSHTRYGALGTLAIGEGGGELAKQLVGKTYDFARPGVVAIYLTGAPKPGVGPHDVALSICGAVYKNGYVKNKVMEFVGPGIKNLPIEYRNAIDVMTTETTCWSSIWVTDETTKKYFTIHGRPEAYKEIKPADVAYYDGCVYIDLSTVECTIAMPMHPSNTYTIHELQKNAADILHLVQENANKQIKGAKMDIVSKYHDGAIWVEQGEIAGCAGGTFDNICAAADILRGKSCGNGAFTLSIYPGSMPALAELIKNGRAADLVSAGAIMRECFCGPCFGAGDTPANGEFSIRHTTRNFPNREGSKPGEGQMAAVALMDARSIAATAANGGKLTAATDIEVEYTNPEYKFDGNIYKKRVYNGWTKPEPKTELKFGPNIKDWPAQPPLTDDLLVKVCSYITDPVTTTDELIPSGETSSYRSNPERLSEFALSRRDPQYVSRSKVMRQQERDRETGKGLSDEVKAVYAALTAAGIKNDPENTDIGSTIFANMPGDGSAREQAASCQRVMGAFANFAKAYATKRYRSNCINWGMTPFLVENPEVFELGDYLFVPGVRQAVLENKPSFPAYAVKTDGTVTKFSVSTGVLTEAERQIIVAGCLINYYRNH
ncbi:hydratase [Caproicibacterium sp. BJN0003]|uniref:hydratase n=1 Tax=Caproicibacterium sp. BJN0003 TaxID=2994078 RepID=UPI0022593ABF|nr:hydratase [Caproicibacterium sp. BJN0003]UZT82563.1 hydratase [Caproicibacterium sp. BJN0003]